MKKQIIKLLIAMLVITTSSCSVRLIDFTVISSKNTQMAIDVSRGVRTKGESWGPFGLGANIKDAMDKALTKAGPGYDLLIDGVVRQTTFVLVAGYQVEGTAVKSAMLRAAMGDVRFKEWCAEHAIKPEMTN